MKSSVLNRLNKAFNDTIILIEDKNEEIKELKKDNQALNDVINKMHETKKELYEEIDARYEEIKQLNLSSVKTAIENDRLVNKLKKGLNNAINEI